MAGPFIKRIRVQNFKSFADADLELNRFNVIVGANAAGKSNLVQIFRFLRDIRRDGLDNAVSMQGGPQYIHNLRLGDNSTSIELETALSKGFRIPVPTKHKAYSTGGEMAPRIQDGGAKDRDSGGFVHVPRLRLRRAGFGRLCGRRGRAAGGRSKERAPRRKRQSNAQRRPVL